MNVKVGFYLENENFKDVDCRSIENGNPGIGGTEYMIWYISSMLSQTYSDLSIVLYANSIELLPGYINKIKVKGELEAIQYAEKECDILILRGPYISELSFEYLNKSHLKVITWCHNYEKHPWCSQIAKTKAIVRNVCVGKEQLERLIDTELFKKSIYIFNTIQFDLYKQIKREKTHKVCYIGSLHKSKGFHKLAEIWPEVLKRVPDAELYVIGSGKLYNKNQRLGQFQLADEKYERTFLKPLMDKRKNIHPSVHFMGVIGGKSKIDLMKSMQVGIVNPVGVDETFCIGAIEFQAMSIPVVSIKKYALLDTIEDGKSGLLFTSKKEFVDYIVELLLNDKKNTVMGKYAASFVAKKFDGSDILEQWHDLILDVFHGSQNKCKYTCSNHFNNKKWLREANRKLRNVFPFLPTVIWYENIPHEVMEIIRKIKKNR